MLKNSEIYLMTSTLTSRILLKASILKSVTHSSSVFKDENKPIQHLGFMDAVADTPSQQAQCRCSHIIFYTWVFREYLGAILRIPNGHQHTGTTAGEYVHKRVPQKHGHVPKQPSQNSRHMNWELVKLATLDRRCWHNPGKQRPQSRYSAHSVFGQWKPGTKASSDVYGRRSSWSRKL